MKNFFLKEITILPNTSIQEAIKLIDKGEMQIALVSDKSNHLLGTITDGDIRRSLIHGATLEESIDNVMNKNPIIAKKNSTKQELVSIMQSNKIHQIPIVDDDNSILDLLILDELIMSKLRQNTIVIMCGGKGKRLGKYTENCPKPMLDIRGKPMLEHIIERAKENGFKNFILAINHLGNMIEDYFKNGSDWKISIEYLRETEPLGTAGALSLIKDIPSEPIVVVNGDVMSNINFGEMIDYHEERQAFATMAVRQHEVQNPFGEVKTMEGKIVGFEEKPIYASYINAGIYIIEPTSLKLLKKNKLCDMPNFFMQIKNNSENVIVYPMNESWLDLGSPNDLLWARENDI